MAEGLDDQRIYVRSHFIFCLTTSTLVQQSTQPITQCVKAKVTQQHPIATTEELEWDG